MRAVIFLSCILGIALCAPAVERAPQRAAKFPGDVHIDASNPMEAVRKRRHLLGLDVDIYNNNGFGAFNNGYDYYGGVGYGGYGGYPGEYGGFGGYPGGFGGYPGGFGGYPGGFGGYPGGFGGYPGYGGFGGYPGYGGFF